MFPTAWYYGSRALFKIVFRDPPDINTHISDILTIKLRK